MKVGLMLALLAAVGGVDCACAPNDGSGQQLELPSIRDIEQRLIADGHARPEIVSVVPVDGSAGVFLATYEWDPNWWGGFMVIGFADGHITWIADVAAEPQEQAIYRARVIQARGHAGPLVEIIGLTHMGHGQLYVYRLDGRALTRLLAVPVLDWHDDGAQFGRPHHRVVHADRNTDSISDIELTGTIVTANGERPYSQVYCWHPAFDRFTPCAD